MMNLYIVRHAEALTNLEDPARFLNDLGKSQASKVALFLKDKKQPVKNIFHSSKERSKQTAEIIGQSLSGVKIDLLSALEPEEDIQMLLQVVDYLMEDTLLVGHIPQVELLAHYLLSSQESYPVAAFDTAAIMCFKKETSFWVLSWFINPSLL